MQVVIFIVALLVCTTVAAPSGTTAISTATYNNCLRFAYFSSAAYIPTCTIIQSTGVVQTTFSDPGTDTQGYIALDKIQGQIIVAFRGSTSTADFERDLDIVPTGYSSPISDKHCLLCTVHSGFFGAWNAVKTVIIDTVQSLHSAHSTFTIIVTGHSLGGALTSFCALGLKGAGLSGVQVYSYGEPRVGDTYYANFVDSQLVVGNLYRSTHTTDTVPQMIPKSGVYQHHSTEYYIYADPSSVANTVKCNGQEDSNCIDSVSISFSNSAALLTSASPHHTYYGVGMGDTCL